MKKPVMHSIWLVLVLSVLSSSVCAGTLGPLTYEIADGQVRITDCHWMAAGVVIPDEIEGLPVTSIGNSAFDNCSYLGSVIIPNRVTSIGDDAFKYCQSLTSITIPNSVTSIGEGAFYGCSSLTSLSIPDSVTSIGYTAFYKCLSLTYITIPDSVTSIGDSAFVECNALESIVVPAAFHSRAEARRIGSDATGELYLVGRYTTHSNNTHPPTTPSIRMAPVIMVQGEEGSVKTIEVSESPDGPWRFWMDVTATTSGVAITDLDGQAHKRFYRVRD